MPTVENDGHSCVQSFIRLLWVCVAVLRCTSAREYGIQTRLIQQLWVLGLDRLLCTLEHEQPSWIISNEHMSQWCV